MRKLICIALLALTAGLVGASEQQFEVWKDSFNLPLMIAKTAGSGSVNFLVLQNATTGNGPTFAADGSDANISPVFKAKGTGVPVLQDGSGNPVLSFVKTASAVNQATISNAATGNGVAAITNVARSTTTVTVTAANSFVVGQYVNVQAVTNNGTTTQAANINGVWKVATASPTQFTYTDSISGTIASGADTGTVTPLFASGPAVTATGTDSNVGLMLITKGTGTVKETLGGSTAVCGLMGMASSQTTVGGVLCTAGSTDDTLFAFTLPANTLINVGDFCRVTCYGLGSASAGTFKTFFGGTAFCTDGGVTSATPVRQVITVVKTGASTQMVYNDDNYHGTTANIARAAPTTAAIVDTADIPILFTANSGAATEKGFGMIVEVGHQ